MSGYTAKQRRRNSRANSIAEVYGVDMDFEKFWRNIPYIFANGLFAFLLYENYGIGAVVLALVCIALVIYMLDFEVQMYRLIRFLEKIARSDKWYLAYIIGGAVAVSVLPLILCMMNYTIYLVRGGGKRIERILEAKKKRYKHLW